MKCYFMPLCYMFLILTEFFQEPVGADGRGEERTWYETEEDGTRNGASLWNESQRKETETQGFRNRCKFLL